MFTPPEQELERTMALVDERAIGRTGEDVPLGRQRERPLPGDIWTQSPVRSGFDPAAACSLFRPGSPATPRSMVDRLLDGAAGVGRGHEEAVQLVVEQDAAAHLDLLAAEQLQALLGVPPGDEAARPSRAAPSPAVSKISSPSKALPETTTVPWPLAGITGTPLTLRTTVRRDVDAVLAVVGEAGGRLAGADDDVHGAARDVEAVVLLAGAPGVGDGDALADVHVPLETAIPLPPLF